MFVVVMFYAYWQCHRYCHMYICMVSATVRCMRGGMCIRIVVCKCLCVGISNIIGVRIDICIGIGIGVGMGMGIVNTMCIGGGRGRVIAIVIVKVVVLSCCQRYCQCFVYFVWLLLRSVLLLAYWYMFTMWYR